MRTLVQQSTTDWVKSGWVLNETRNPSVGETASLCRHSWVHTRRTMTAICDRSFLGSKLYFSLSFTFRSEALDPQRTSRNPSICMGDRESGGCKNLLVLLL